LEFRALDDSIIWQRKAGQMPIFEYHANVVTDTFNNVTFQSDGTLVLKTTQNQLEVHILSNGSVFYQQNGGSFQFLINGRYTLGLFANNIESL